MMSNKSRWRPHTTGILIGGFVLILVALVASYMVQHFQTNVTQVSVGSGVFNAKLALNDADRKHGLSGVATLKPSDALLMQYDSDGKWSIWMKDMQVPLDIVWLDGDKKVVYIVTNAPVEPDDTPDSMRKTYTSTNDARYVLELPAGSVKQSGIAIGAKADFTIEGEQ